MRWVLVSALFLAGCGRAGGAAFVPTVVVHGAVARGRGGEGEESADWWVGVDARWRLSRVEPRDVEPAPPPLAEPTPTACASARLCAWERRQRVRALRSFGRER